MAFAIYELNIMAAEDEAKTRTLMTPNRVHSSDRDEVWSGHEGDGAPRETLEALTCRI